MLPTLTRMCDFSSVIRCVPLRDPAAGREVLRRERIESARGVRIRSVILASEEMISTWHRVTWMALVGVLTFYVTGALAQDQEGWKFIPAPDEPCGVNCPDPDAPLSRVNYPPRDDNFKNMFVSTESGLRIVQNTHWNGTETNLSFWCGVHCRDPYAPVGVTNQFRRNDAQEIALVFYRDGEDVVLRSKPNPHWVGRNEAIEAIELMALSAPLPLMGLGPASGELDPGAEEPGHEVVRRSLDRTRVAYHAYGNDVFQPRVLQSIGGVLSQASVAEGRDGPPPKVEFVLRLDGTYPGYVLVSYGDVTGRYRIRYDELVPMALFVNSGGTSLYTLWEDKLPPNFQREAGFAKYEGGPGFLALEFADTRFAEAMYFLDVCRGCITMPDDGTEAAVNARATFATGTISERPSSYINTDVGSTFELEETSVGAVKVRGRIVRFHWSGDARTGVAVDRKQLIVRPGELQTNVNHWLAEHEVEHMLQLMIGIDVRKEASILAYRRLGDAFFLFETLALMRATKRYLPDDWSAFMALLSSDWLVRQNWEPWKRYTQTFCSVYPHGGGCRETN